MTHQQFLLFSETILLRARSKQSLQGSRFRRIRIILLLLQASHFLIQF
jgi:hypothetical protein